MKLYWLLAVGNGFCDGFLGVTLQRRFALVRNGMEQGKVKSLAVTTSLEGDNTETKSLAIPSQCVGTVTFLIPHSLEDQQRPTKFGNSSPVPNPSILEAVQQIAKKCSWFSDGLIETNIISVPDDEEVEVLSSKELLETDVLIALGLEKDSDVKFASVLFEKRRSRSESLKFRQCQFALDCCNSVINDGSFGQQNLPIFCGPFDPSSPNFQSTFLPWTDSASGRRLSQQMTQLFGKWNSDDFVFSILIFLNRFSGSEIDWVKHSIDATWEKGFYRNAVEFYQMLTKCGDCIGTCLQDETCKKCLDTLTQLEDSRDQVASYRTIVSFESDLLRDFSFCILQKNNIFGCNAVIPTLPRVTPISVFRGKPVTPDVARSLLVGHLEGEATALSGSLSTSVSWMVNMGANEAYDKFPSQSQLFYPAARGSDMWYDPVFRVETLDGRDIWCKRHYKVRPQKVPGTFRFSVLDNGVTSDEFWTIVAVDDDLRWIVFHYAGAARAVGLRYLGGLVCTPDGQLPPDSELPRIWKAIKAAGFQPWELYCVDNDPHSAGYRAAGPPPLNFFRQDVLALRK